MAEYLTLLGALILMSVVVAILVAVLRRAFIPLVGLAAAAGLAAIAYKRHQSGRLLREFRRKHGASGKDLLLVFTDSPHWRAYIEEHWLSKWSDRAVIFNRSQPWTHEQIEAQLWVNVAGDRDHTPLAIVVPPIGRATVVRFWKAFRDHKHGKDRALREAEKTLELALGYRSSH